jgi:hypothetical protein
MSVDTIKYRGYTIHIEQDIDPLNPRTDYDNLGTMVCFHPRYNLGDKDHAGFKEPEDLLEYLKRERKNLAVVLPLYLLDHSGLWMKTGRFACDSAGWDTSNVGVIFITKEQARKEYGWKLITKERKEKLAKYLEGEVELYSSYLEGAVYGFYGYEHDKSGLLPDAQSAVDHHIKRVRALHFYKLKAWLRHKVSLLKRWGAPEGALA